MAESNQRGGVRRRKYPFLSLEQAIDRARQLYEAERRNRVSADVVLTHWGYTSAKSGIATTTLSAVRQFGLLDEDGRGEERRIGISERAYAILHAPEEIRRKAIRDAALEPPIHRLVWKKYGSDIGSDVGFKWYLLNDLGFSERGAKEFTKQYQATIKFAGLFKSEDAADQAELLSETEETPTDHPDIPPWEAVVDGLDEEAFRQNVPPLVDVWNTESGPVNVRVPESRPSARATRHAIPLVGGKQVILEGEFPITEEAWAGFMAILQAFKPGLVALDEND